MITSIDFQELAVEMRYQDKDLKHQFMVRLKEKIRDHCLLSNPPPYMMGEWMERAMMVQRQMDLSKAMRNGTNMAGAFQKKPTTKCDQTLLLHNIQQLERKCQITPKRSKIEPNSNQWADIWRTGRTDAN